MEFNDEEYQKLILSFRVSELTALLTFAGRSRGGRKSELQQRALEVLALRTTPFYHKVRKLHEEFVNDLSHTAQQQANSAVAVAQAPPTLTSSAVVLSTNSNMQPHNNRGYPGYPPGRVPPAAALQYNSNPFHHQQQAHQHNAYAPPGNKPPMSNAVPLHPDVRFKRLPFYDHVSELIKPSSLIPHGNQRQQENCYTFHLSPAQADMISMSRDIRPGSRAEYGTQVQLRFCLVETTSEQEDCFPPGIMVKVNQKACQLPNPIPPNKPGVEPKRPPRPVNITPLVKVSPVVPNSIQVLWSTDYTRGYVLAVHLVNKRSSEDLLNRLKAKGVRIADYTRGMIKEKLKEDGEISTTSLRVSIACPLGKMRMTTPCRASTCQHFQCFDASLYLQMNEKKPQWVCPVCHKNAVYDKLVIDGYFQEVLESSVLPVDCTDIELNKSGAWTPLLTTKKEQSTVVEKVETPIKPEPVKMEQVVSSDKKDGDKVPVFTLSDSDDDDAPLMPKKRSSSDAFDQPTTTESQKPVSSQRHSPSLIIIDDESPTGSPAAPQAPVPAYNSNGRQYGYNLTNGAPYPY